LKVNHALLKSAAGLISFDFQAYFRKFSLSFERSFEILSQAKSNDQASRAMEARGSRSDFISTAALAQCLESGINKKPFLRFLLSGGAAETVGKRLKIIS